MAAENLLGNVPNKVQGEYQRPLPRDFELASIGQSPWKNETGVYGWDSRGVLPACITVADFSSAPPTETDGDIYIGTTDTTAVHADWDGASKYDWVRFTADTSSWSSFTPSEGVLCYDTSNNTWYSSDTTANGWNELQQVLSETSYSKKTVDIGDWDMDTTGNVDIAHNLSATEWKTIRTADVIIRNDADTGYYKLNSNGSYYIDANNFRLSRTVGADFDDVTFDSTAYNRGWITFEYTKD